jgi:hypothetical protein
MFIIADTRQHPVALQKIVIPAESGYPVRRGLSVIFARLYADHPMSKDLDIDQIAGALGPVACRCVTFGPNLH